MSYSLLLLSLSPSFHLHLSFSLRAVSPFSVLLPPRFSHPSGSLPSWRCSIEIQFPPTYPSHLPTLSPFLHLLLYISPTKPLFTIRETLSTRERKPPAAFRAINYAAQLFTGISCLSDYTSTVRRRRRRYPARRDVNTKTGDFKWSA